MKRAEYWDREYADYWEARTKEAEISEVKSILFNDKKVSGLSIYRMLINQLVLNPNEKVLEVGSGLGRSIPILVDKQLNVYAADISNEMARIVNDNYRKVIELVVVAEAETLPFQAEYFDIAICFAVFDALEQKCALLEFERVLKPGGQLLITGKNNYYYTDDSAALIAEINARSKGHPNSFTDCQVLLQNLSAFGFALLSWNCFKRRGDFSNYKCVAPKPTEPFYEFAMILQKQGQPQLGRLDNLNIASSSSRTFQMLNEPNEKF